MDVLLHMNNGKYLSIMDLGRIDMTLRSGFYQKFSKKGWYPVIAEQTIQYLRSIEAFQKFDIVTQIIGGDEKGILLSQNFECDGKLMARAVVRARFLKKTGGKVTTDELLSIAGGDIRLPKEPDWVTSWSQNMQVLRKDRGRATKSIPVA